VPLVLAACGLWRGVHRPVDSALDAVPRGLRGKRSRFAGGPAEPLPEARRPLLRSPPRALPGPLSSSTRTLLSPEIGDVRVPAPDPELPAAWSRFNSALRRAVSDSTWHIWLEPLQPRELDGITLVVEAPGASRAWIERHFARLLGACAEAALGPGGAIRVIEAGAPAPADGPTGHAPVAAAGDGVDRRLTFEDFVIGDGNRFAHAAALAVAEEPGLAYNPLVICGPPGLGKTHLLHAIANYVLDHGAGLSVRVTTAEAFTNAFVAALHDRRVEAFKAAHRGVDVLLVDDVQFLQAKAKTEEEFFHTFNALHQAGAQLVLTSDRPPRDLQAMEDRLRARFEAGLVCEVAPPDEPTRLTILRKRAAEDDVPPVDPAALALLADTVKGSVRALEAALIRVVAFASLTGRAVDAALASEVLAGLYPDLRTRRRTVEDIQRETCRAFGVTMEELLSHSRAQPVAWPRQVAMYLARELTDATLPAIGRAFGGRNHTTVLHACRRTAERIASDRAAHEAVQRLADALRSA
jgi:chromosomal replication initiator protein